MKIHPSNNGWAGFTLIEIVIAVSLMSLILVSAYLCLNAGLSSQKLIEPRSEIIQNARVAMALIAADLRGACPLSADSEFLGMQRTLGSVEADNLDFATHNYTPRGPRQRMCQESIYVDVDRENGQFGLSRRRNPAIALDPLSGGRREEIAKGVVGLRFEYFDGEDWYNTWGKSSVASCRDHAAQPAESLRHAFRRACHYLVAGFQSEVAGGFKIGRARH